MKKLHIIYLFTLFLILQGCSDYLDEIPDNRIEINTLDKATQLLVGAYPNADYLFTDWFTEEAEYIETNTQTPLMTASFLWEDLEEYDDDNSPSNFWYKAYEAIAQANAAIESLDLIRSDDVDFKNSIKGEALMCRAYAHFMLANMFCNNYGQSSAINDMGIPYVTKSEKVLIEEYSRGTLEQTYRNIENDLNEGMALLSDDYYSGSKKYHFTKKAAFAFACRFYLYKKDYKNSIVYADTILGKNSVDETYIKNLIDYSNQSGVLAKRNFYVSNTDASNIMIIEKTVSLGLRHNYGYRTGVKSWSKLFDNSVYNGSNDLRGLHMAYYGDGNRNTIRAAKFNEEFYKESLTATTGYPFFVHPVFRGVELLFNRVESNIILGNLPQAMSDLNVIGKLRYLSNPLTIADIQAYYAYEDVGGVITMPTEADALMALLLDEKRKEYIHEGMRWFDVKRHSIEVKHFTLDGIELTLEKDDKRKVFQIPLDASERGIEKNPR